MPLPPLGFTASAARRGAIAAAYAVVALAAVWLVEGAAAPGPAAAHTTAPPVAAVDTAPLVIEASYDVARWTVLLAGAPVAPTATDHRHWRGAAALSAGQRELFVQAEGADPLADGPCALRLTLGEGAMARRRTFWGEGSVSATWRGDGRLDGDRP
jgi:hypothetical protein